MTGDFGTGDPGADPRRARPDQRQLHAGNRHPAGHPAAIGRVARQADRGGGAQCRPSLGNDSIEAGKRAGIIGGIATIALTVLVYGTFGIFACVGLVVHGVLTVGAQTRMGSALTLRALPVSCSASPWRSTPTF